MMFYNHLLLQQFSETWPQLFDYNSLLKKQKSKSYLPINITKLECKVEFQYELQEVHIKLQVLPKEKEHFPFWIGLITINTTPANCGSLIISNLNARIQRSGIGSWMLKQIENWAIDAGYSMIYGNVPDYREDYNDPLNFFEEMGYEPMGKPYINVRSGNPNRWFYKIIQLPQEEE